MADVPKGRPAIMSADELRRRLELASIPIDFDKLVTEGILARKGRRYLILDYARLPEALHYRTKSMSQTKDGLAFTFYPHATKGKSSPPKG